MGEKEGEKRVKGGKKGGIDRKSRFDATDATRPGNGGQKVCQKVMAIDPGISGAFVVTDGENFLRTFLMPVDAERIVSFSAVEDFLQTVLSDFGAIPVFLERAVPMAMGAKGAFTYGRGFQVLVLALTVYGFPFTLVEPSKWAKEMHEGISADLKPKAKSLIAARRLYPRLFGQIPEKARGGVHDGPVDALLIAGWALRKRFGHPMVAPTEKELNLSHLNARLNGASIQVLNPENAHRTTSKTRSRARTKAKSEPGPRPRLKPKRPLIVAKTGPGIVLVQTRLNAKGTGNAGKACVSCLKFPCNCEIDDFF